MEPITTYLLLFPSLLCLVTGKYSEGVISTNENWIFLDRFCFMSDVGRLYYEIQYPEDYAVQKLYLYYDSKEQWPAVYKSSKNCEEREDVLFYKHRQIVNLSSWTVDRYNWPGCHSQNGLIQCNSFREFSSLRNRWWYVALGNCNSTSGLYLKYKMWMTNSESGDMWRYHFSADEFYILPSDMAFVILEFLLMAVAVTVALILKARQMLHVTFKLYMVAVLLECFSLISDCIHYGVFSNDGVGLPGFEFHSQVLRAASTILFIFVLIIMAKGYTVTRARFSKKGRVKLFFFMCSLIICYVVLFIWQEFYFDPGEVTYLYESFAGYMIIALRIAGWVWFCYAVYFTLVKYPEKRTFYFVFAATFSLWFWMGPCVIITVNHFLGKWMRMKIANGVENSVAFMGFCAFLYILRPSATNLNFPYHVRTTQIGAILENVDVAANNESVSLPHFTYEHRNYDVFTIPNRVVGAEEDNVTQVYKMESTTPAPSRPVSGKF